MKFITVQTFEVPYYGKCIFLDVNSEKIYFIPSKIYSKYVDEHNSEEIGMIDYIEPKLWPFKVVPFLSCTVLISIDFISVSDVSFPVLPEN